MDEVGADDLQDCKSCPDGQFETAPGKAACKQCPVGKRGTTSTSKHQEDAACARCTAGKYQNQTGQLQCEDCSQGTFSSGEMQTQCTPCQVIHARTAYTMAEVDWHCCARLVSSRIRPARRAVSCAAQTNVRLALGFYSVVVLQLGVVRYDPV